MTTYVAQKPPAVQAVHTTAAAPTNGGYDVYNPAGGALAPTLPALSTPLVANSAQFIVEKDATDTSNNAVTVTCAGSDTFRGGATTVALLAPGERVEVQAANIGGVNVWKTLRHAMPRSASDARYGKVALVSELTYPLAIAHRGAANLFPENSLEAFEGAVSLGFQAIEGGDIQAMADGTLLTMHDSTIDRTSSSAGNVSALSLTGSRLAKLDSSVWFSSRWPDLNVPTFDDVLNRLGGRVVMTPEVKDGLDSTAVTMVNKIKARGLQKSMIVASFTYSNMQIVAAAGIATMYTFTSTTDPTKTPAQMAADGITHVAFLYNAANAATYITSLHAAGIKAIAWTVDRQVDWDVALAAGFDGIYTNEHWAYVTRTYASYRKTASQWGINGTWGPGMIAGSQWQTGPYDTTQRGDINKGAAGAWRWRPRPVYFASVGDICPIAAAAGTYSVTFAFAFDIAGSADSQGACMWVGATGDGNPILLSNVTSSYMVKVRGSGTINAWKIASDGTAPIAATAITGTAVSQPVLSSGLTAGAAITALPVNAIPIALKSGHQFYLPTGQVVTLTAGAAVNATSLTVSSVTPSAAVATGTALVPRIVVRVDVTPTTVTWTRVDEPTATNNGTVITDSAFRGGYVYLSNYTTGTSDVSFESVTVT